MEETSAKEAKEVKEVCRICQEELRNAPRGSDKEPVASKCDPDLGHVFHRVCYEEWLQGKQAINKTCPICQRDPLAEVRVEKARKATMARIIRKKQYESGITGKLRLMYGAAREASTVYWREQIAPNARTAALVVFGVVFVLCVLVLGISRLKQHTLDALVSDGIIIDKELDDDMVVTTLEKIKKGEL